MPYTTVVAGTTITATWSNTNNRDQVITPFASATARDSAITSPVEGMHCYLTDTDKTMVYNGAAWVPANSNIIASQALTANSSGFTSSTTTDFALASVKVRAERLYRVNLKSAVEIVNAPGRWIVNLHVDGVATDRLHDVDITASEGANSHMFGSTLWEPTTGTKNLDIQVSEVTGASTLTFTGASTARRLFWVEDIGPR